MLAGSPEKAIPRSVAAISVGVIGGQPRLDLNYAEDSTADVDMNIVCTGEGDFVEVQGTGENAVFHREELNALLDLGAAGCAELADLQARALATPIEGVRP
jgi:ribonuclease PH